MKRILFLSLEPTRAVADVVHTVGCPAPEKSGFTEVHLGRHEFDVFGRKKRRVNEYLGTPEW